MEAEEAINTPARGLIGEDVDSGSVDLPTELNQLLRVVTQSAHRASAEQQRGVLAILDKARHETCAWAKDAD